jgi:DNA-binding transcriptional regulator YdaS (Cro superfamily)
VSAPEKLVGINAAVLKAKGQSKLAQGVGVSQQAVHKWVQRGCVPVHRAVAVERLTGVPREQLVNPRLVGLLEVAK